MWHGYGKIVKTAGISIECCGSTCAYLNADYCATMPHRRIIFSTAADESEAIFKGEFPYEPDAALFAAAIAACSEMSEAEAREEITSVSVFDGDTYEERQAAAQAYVRGSALYDTDNEGA